ncbi:MAG: hypothetical protein HUJ62_05915 [Streptococcus gallolyticus]|nr:hypothetical protein [Streptococcus gallolyticus]
MALLTKDAQEKVVNLLVNEGLADIEWVNKVREETLKTKQPLLQTLIAKKIITNSAMIHASAIVIGATYVNLEHVRVNQQDLKLLTREVSEQSMTVALGELNGQLVVAMLDVSNVQAIDYLSTLTHKPIKAVMATEEGIKQVLSQYKGDFASVSQAEKATRDENSRQAAAKEGVQTISEDSPISKALTSILEYAVKSKASMTV